MTVREGHPRVVTELFMQARTPHDGMCALHLAASDGHAEV